MQSKLASEAEVADVLAKVREATERWRVRCAYREASAVWQTFNCHIPEGSLAVSRTALV